MDQEMTDGGQAQDTFTEDVNTSTDEINESSDEHVSEGTQGTENPSSDSVWEKRYKDLQSTVTPLQQNRARLDGAFGAFGGPEQAAQALTNMMSDPEIRAVLERKENGGIADEQLDEETLSAKKTVNQWIKEALKSELSATVAPVMDVYRKERVGKFTERLDREYPEWRDYESDMAPIIQEWPEQRKLSMDYNDLEGLLLQAVAKKGKISTFVKQTYERDLAKRKQTAQTMPGVAPKTRGKPVTDVLEAVQLSAKELGISL